MRKILLFTLAAAAALAFIVPETWAQDSATDEFTLEEIMVTAEKREVNVQSVAASLLALPGDDLLLQGKATAAQMLESVPNVVYGEGGRNGSPNDNITIRGVKRTQEPGGGSPVPSSTSTYVDGVFEGIGGNYDINRIEVLRGPQGTLYGRSATGGVVAFHTNNPKLEEFGGNVTVEYGSGSRINTQGAINVPAGDKFALRAAVHYLHQDEGYFNDDKGGENTTTEGRIKALYQPSENLSFLLSFSATEIESYEAGYSMALTAPNTIDYQASYFPANVGDPTQYTQGSLEVNYDLGDSTLTYIAAIHTMDNIGLGAIGLNRSSYQQVEITGDPNKTMTHEIRWASDSDGPLTWLIGGNYYKNTWDRISQVMQIRDLASDDPASFNAPLFGEYNKGDITDYGIFTEETFELSDDMRITAGLRYDKTKINNFAGQDFNANLGLFMVALNPPNIIHNPPDATYRKDTPDFDNLTYKLRFEYDLTPDNMLYALTSTGFLPGNSQINVQPMFSGEFPAVEFAGVQWITLPFDQEKLTSYEVGSKNRFLNNRLQLNVDAFYYDFEGYQESINITPHAPPPPTFVVVRVPVRMYGLEVDGTWLITPNDKVTFSAGWLDAQLKSYPNVPGMDPPTPAKEFMYLKRVPGLPEYTATLGYDHTFLFGNGSSLVPRAELRYTSDYYLGQVTSSEAASSDAEGNSYLDYVHQDAVVLVNIGATWSSPQDMYSVTGYIRNTTDEEYKTSATLPSGPPGTPTGVTVGDPRTWGIMASIKF